MILLRPPALLLLGLAGCVALRAQPPPVDPALGRATADSHAGSPVVRQLMETYAGEGVLGNRALWLSPRESLRQFKTQPGLTVDLIAHEPDVVQPVYLSFDSRGWLWVMQYIQFQFPAGLKIVSYDEWLRAVFDRVPEPPPRGPKGLDRVALFRPVGDGTYVKVRDVITGLNIATAAIKGAGGIWVLNPPYLLFYPVLNDGDVPVGDPEVCLSGFGLQDTHSEPSSLQFGPDGWLYGANGSTTSGLISSRVTKNVRMEGQHIWRYHPRTHVFEIYAEGGGNTFSLEIDAVGRVFSGTNYGPRGMHYEQGMSGLKNFGKHGLADNPYAFGYFGHIETLGDKRRFSQAFCIYDGGLMADRLGGHFLAGNALHNLVHDSRRVPDTSTFQAVDEAPLLTTSDKWFRPVDIKVGPDGGVWLADWYDSRMSYDRPVDDWSKTDGRIYRIRPSGAQMGQAAFDLHTVEPHELLKLLQHPNKWFRRQAALELAWRGETALLPDLTRLALDGSNPHAFDTLTALAMLGGLSDSLALQFLRHPDPYVRRWTVRCIGDTDEASPAVAQALVALAAAEQQPEVRTQLLASAKRLPAGVALPIVRVMLERSADLADRRVPLLLWWVLESKAESDREAVLDLMADPAVWRLPLAQASALGQLAQRWAMAGGKANYEACARLLAAAPDGAGRTRVVAGLAAAFEGGPVPPLPPALATPLNAYLASAADTDLAFAVRAGNAAATARALAIARDPAALNLKRAEMIRALADAGNAETVPLLVAVFEQPGSPRLKQAVLPAASKFDDLRLPRAVLEHYVDGFAVDAPLRAAADRMLASRLEWAKLFLAEVDMGTPGKVGRLAGETQHIAADALRQLELYHDPVMDRIIRQQWPSAVARLSSREKRAEMDRIRAALTQPGDPTLGRETFTQRCSVCHTLFDTGGHIGPELTGYQRNNLDFWLTAIVDPSLEIREGYALYSARLKNGQTAVGLLVREDAGGIVLKNLSGELQAAKADQIESLAASPVSLMPEGLLSGMSPKELRDFFAYLMKP